MVVTPWPPLFEQLAQWALAGVLVWAAFLLVGSCVRSSARRRRRRP